MSKHRGRVAKKAPPPCIAPVFKKSPAGFFWKQFIFFMLPSEGFTELQRHLSRVYFSFQDLYRFILGPPIINRFCKFL
nr:MAG TPA: hypothetical protein [Bacteriophage sp.]